MGARRPVGRRLAIRGLPADVYRALEAERRRSGGTLNATVIDLLRKALGVHEPGRRTNGLERLAGGWNDAEAAEFDAAMAVFEQVDPSFWQ